MTSQLGISVVLLSQSFRKGKTKHKHIARSLSRTSGYSSPLASVTLRTFTATMHVATLDNKDIITHTDGTRDHSLEWTLYNTVYSSLQGRGSSSDRRTALTTSGRLCSRYKLGPHEMYPATSRSALPIFSVTLLLAA